MLLITKRLCFNNILCFQNNMTLSRATDCHRVTHVKEDMGLEPTRYDTRTYFITPRPPMPVTPV